jgi:hypothetical protein
MKNKPAARVCVVIVIPGRREAANPESSHVHNFWIPGSLALRAPRNDSYRIT